MWMKQIFMAESGQEEKNICRYLPVANKSMSLEFAKRCTKREHYTALLMMINKVRGHVKIR